MTLLALLAIICFGFATYNLTCAFVDIPTKKTSRMMMLASRASKQKSYWMSTLPRSPGCSLII